MENNQVWHGCSLLNLGRQTAGLFLRLPIARGCRPLTGDLPITPILIFGAYTCAPRRCRGLRCPVIASPKAVLEGLDQQVMALMKMNCV